MVSPGKTVGEECLFAVHLYSNNVFSLQGDS